MLLKGAPERILDKCANYMSLSGEKSMNDRDKRAFIKNINEIAAQGLRCLAIAVVPNSG